MCENELSRAWVHFMIAHASTVDWTRSRGKQLSNVIINCPRNVFRLFSARVCAESDIFGENELIRLWNVPQCSIRVKLHNKRSKIWIIIKKKNSYDSNPKLTGGLFSIEVLLNAWTDRLHYIPASIALGK